jgi:hypothetical protein
MQGSLSIFQEKPQRRMRLSKSLQMMLRMMKRKVMFMEGCLDNLISSQLSLNLTIISKKEQLRRK